MKVVIYSTKSFEREFFVNANQDKHTIGLVADPLSLATCSYAAGNDAVIVFTNDDVSAPVVNKLADMGIKYIATRSTGTDHLDKAAAALRGIKLANVPSYSPHAIAEHTVALAMALNRHLIKANQHAQQFDFRLKGQIGFNFQGKTVGLIGLGHIGQAVAGIFNGFGCRVLAYDVAQPEGLKNIELCTLNEVLRLSDIISLHVPLTPETKYLINAVTLAKMKKGVMLINTSRGGLINTEDALEALNTHQLGYLGIDVYEHEKGLFFEDHRHDAVKDALLEQLLAHPNVLITPHQAFLTNEALQQIAEQTVDNLDKWQAGESTGLSTIS